MKQKINLILGTILLICIAQIRAQENTTVQFLINDHLDRPLTGMLKVKIDVVGDNMDWKDLANIYIFNGAYDLPVDLNIEEGDSGSIMVTYYPSEYPLGKDSQGKEVLMSSPIDEDAVFGLDSPMIGFTLPARNELFFKLSFAFDLRKVRSMTKTGAEREVSKSTELSENVKKMVEGGFSIWLIETSAGYESEEGKTETNELVDREMTETEKGESYSVKIPTGRLTIEQTNKP